MTKAGERTSGALLEHAIAAIETGGEGAVKVAAIAEAAGVSVISLYHFYGNREGLIEAALAEMSWRTLTSFNQAIAATSATVTTTDEVRAMVTMWTDAMFVAERAHHRRLQARVYGSTAGRPGLAKTLADAQTLALQSYAEAISDLQERGLVRSDVSPMELAKWTSSLVFSRVVLEVGGDDVDGTVWNALTVQAMTETVLPRS